MQFIKRKKYCSDICKFKGESISKEAIIQDIKLYYFNNSRIPFKREFNHTNAARKRFGSWNRAIIAAGFIPNPVMFANEYKAKDGHICDSLSEKIIDDWLARKELTHIRNVPYPGNAKLTADFVIANYWIEFFGLQGQHKRYDELVKEKLALAKQYKLKFIEIYPHHLFPQNKLEEVFANLSLES
ncbi:MAG: homing endonuclease associated repeat-containing protein [Candidatus Levyibacteriota bacterium]